MPPTFNNGVGSTLELLGKSLWSPAKSTSVPAPQTSGVQPNDPDFVNQWALSNTGQNGGQYGSDIAAEKAWESTTGGLSTVIAIIDSGVDFTHPDLANNRWTNPAPQSGDLHGWDYITESGTIVDEQGHGTAIAGIIGAEGDNLIGISGVMWRSSLMSLRVLDNTGTGDVADAVEAIDYAVAHGADVINISWGTTGNSLALRDALERAIRRNVVVVCSAGNGSQNVDSVPYYPASFGIRDLISVAATDNFDQLASWSNWGRSNVAVAAPGINILTTQMGGGYWLTTGTSASAPLVSGVTGRVTFADNLTNGATRDATLDRSWYYDHVGRLDVAYTGSEARATIGTDTWGHPDGPYAHDYNYDVWGNITSRVGWGGWNAQYTASFNNKNRMLTNPANGLAFTYDAAGNTTYDGGQTFTYDALGKQVTSNWDGLQQSYDGDGLRAKKDPRR